jgi:hypothetical protein
MPAYDIDLNSFVELETGVWDALRRGDAEADTDLLSEDFLGVYPSGFASRSDHAGQLAHGPTVAEFEIHEPRLMVISDNDVLLSYRANYQRLASGTRGSTETMYVSSLWSQRLGKWVNVFSQDTPAEGGPAG